MLEELHIQNYALIDRLQLGFEGGFNVLSGETGAGKSILIGAFSLLLGTRADTGAIRSGAEECLVAGQFRIDEKEEALRWLEEHGVTPDDGRVMIRRTVKSNGRGTIYIQSAPLSRAELSDFTSLLVDLHGQHEHQSLLVEERHRQLLDHHAGIESEAKELAGQFAELAMRKRRYEKLLSGHRQRLREAELMQHAVSEIEAARLQAGEEEQLTQERLILSQHEKLFAQLRATHNEIGNGGALSGLRAARQSMDAVVAIDSGMSATAQRLDDLFFELEDVVEGLGDRISNDYFNPGRLEECEDRLALIRRLEQKYGNTVSEVLEYCREAREQLTGLETWEEDRSRLKSEIGEREQQVLARAQELSRLRIAAARGLGQRIESILHALGMPKGRFEVHIERQLNSAGKPVCGPHGIDAVAFRIAPNPGEPLKPLKNVASGGEISRIMLAIKTVLAESDRISTLVFDEIDAGIGGEVALAVGEHLGRIAEHNQALCITHIASIAVRAHNHIRVEKQVKNNRTLTVATAVHGQAQVEEIARMLAGDQTHATSQIHAEELLRRYAPRQK